MLGRLVEKSAFTGAVCEMCTVTLLHSHLPVYDMNAVGMSVSQALLTMYLSWKQFEVYARGLQWRGGGYSFNKKASLNDQAPGPTRTVSVIPSQEYWKLNFIAHQISSLRTITM